MAIKANIHESDSTQQESKPVLDACCGSRMFWFDKQDPRAVYGDVRTESHILCDGRSLEISPDIEFDFTDIPFGDNEFHLVVYDPPHLKNVGHTSWLGKKYGRLPKDFKPMLAQGFAECFRVLKPNGVLIFKWNESQILVSEILPLAVQKPLFGHKSGKQQLTHWITFMKPAEPSQ